MTQRCVQVEMAKSSALGIDTPFVHVEAYLLVGCMALFVTVQVGLLNKALVSFHALSVVATYQIMRLIVSVVGGMLYFGEASTSAGENVGLGIGCVLCVLGTSAMAVQHADSHGEGQSSAKDAQADEAHRAAAVAGDDIDDMLQLLDIDTTTRNWTLVELRQQIVLETATATRLRAEIEEKDARIMMAQMSLAEGLSARERGAAADDST